MLQPLALDVGIPASPRLSFMRSHRGHPGTATAAGGRPVTDFMETSTVPPNRKAWQASATYVSEGCSSFTSQTVYARTKLGAWWKARSIRKNATTFKLERNTSGCDMLEIGMTSDGDTFFEWVEP